MNTKIFAIAAALLLISACAEEGEPAHSYPEITMLSGGYDSYGHYNVEFKLSNKTGHSVYNAYCDLQLTRGNTIIGTAFLYFAAGSTIYSGYEVTNVAVFWDTYAVNPATDYVNWTCNHLDN